MEMGPEKLFEWEVADLKAALKELDIIIGISWSKSKKANELEKALEKTKIDDKDTFESMDTNFYMMQAQQKMQQQIQDIHAQMQEQ